MGCLSLGHSVNVSAILSWLKYSHLQPLAAPRHGGGCQKSALRRDRRYLAAGAFIEDQVTHHSRPDQVCAQLTYVSAARPGVHKTWHRRKPEEGNTMSELS